MSKTPAPRRHWNWAALVYLGMFLITLWMAYTGRLPSVLGYIPFYDKAGHLILYALAAYLGDRVFRGHRLRLRPWSVPTFALGFALFTLVEELAQGMSPHRTFDVGDLFFSGVGIVIGTGLAQWGTYPPRSRPPSDISQEFDP